MGSTSPTVGPDSQYCVLTEHHRGRGSNLVIICGMESISPLAQVVGIEVTGLATTICVGRWRNIKNIKGIVKGSAIQPIERASIFSSSYDFLQTFFLAGLNLFILVIIVLLGMILSRQIRVIDSAHLEYVPEPRKEPDDPMATIDKKIKQRLNGMIDLEGLG